jgi:malonyl CoA-acyl carrier protein transacylase
MAVAQAYQSLSQGDCGLAIVLALDWVADGSADKSGYGTSTPLQGVAMLLQAAAPEHSFATIRVGIGHSLATGESTKSDFSSSDDILKESFNQSQIDACSLTLVDLQVKDSEVIKELLHSLRAIFSRGEGLMPHCALGPLLPASSAVSAMQGLCMVVLALYERVLPALTCAEKLADSSGVTGISSPFCADMAPRPWIERTPRRAGVLGVGAGAVTVLILEEAPRKPNSTPVRLDTTWPVELSLLSAKRRNDLIEQLRVLASHVEAHLTSPLRTLIPKSEGKLPERYRAAIVANNADQLLNKLRQLIQMLTSSDSDSWQTPDGIYFADSEKAMGKTALLIPGQGAQYPGMFGDLCLYLPTLQVWFERLHGAFTVSNHCTPLHLVAPPRLGLSRGNRRRQQKDLFSIRVGAMVTFAGSMGMHELLVKAGVRADALLGYSNGENAALINAGKWRFPSVDHIFGTVASVLGREAVDNSGDDVPHGASVAINKAPRALIGEILAAAEGRVFMSLDNCPDQVVLFGKPDALEIAIQRLQATGATCIRLPFEEGHHTPFYEKHSIALQRHYQDFSFGPGYLPVYSCISTAPFPNDAEQIRQLAASQWTQCVRFGDTVERLYQDGVRCFVEVGPNSTLTGFVRSTLRGRPHTALFSNVQGRPGLDQLLRLLGHLFVLGHNIDLQSLWPVEMKPLEKLVEQGEPGPPPAEPVAEAEDLNVTAPLTTTMALAQHILSGHFERMQDFVKSQQHSHTRLLEALNSNSTPKRSSLQQTVIEQVDHKAWPMLGSPVKKEDGRLIMRRTFTVSSDPFLKHHRFGHRHFDDVETAQGLPIVPFTFNMEIVAEAACCLVGWDAPLLTLHDLRAMRWLAVDQDALIVEIEARLVESAATKSVVHVQVFQVVNAPDNKSERSGPTRVLAFEGFASTGVISNDTTAIITKESAHSALRLTAVQFNERLFHGPLLKSVNHIVDVAAEQVEIEAVMPPTAGLFQDNSNPALRLPAALLDAAGQLVAYWLMEQGRKHFGLFPVQLARYEQFGPPPVSGEKVILRGQTRHFGQMTTTNVDILDESGTTIIHLEGLKMRLYDFPEPYFRCVFGSEPGARLSEIAEVPQCEPSRRIKLESGPFWNEGQGIWARALASLALTKRERQVWYCMKPDERLAWLLRQVVAKELVLDLVEGQSGLSRPAQIETLPSHGHSADHVSDCVVCSGELLRSFEVIPEVCIEHNGVELVAVFKSAIASSTWRQTTHNTGAHREPNICSTQGFTS